MYFIKTPGWLKKIYGGYIWHIPANEKVLYLTFDDGPHPVATPFVLDELKKYNAMASFFCIGKNVMEEPEIFERILQGGHTAGNHTHNHLNGWETNDDDYLKNTEQAATKINSKFFRPPYGRIKKSQGRKLKEKGFKIMMWDVLSGDFDRKISPETCRDNVLKNADPGSIIVFHDSEKAFKNMSFALSETLQFFTEKGYKFKPL